MSALHPGETTLAPRRRETARVTRRGSRTFHLASLLLPRDVRADVHALYWVLRTLDDLVDDVGEPDRMLAAAGVPRDDPIGGPRWIVATGRGGSSTDPPADDHVARARALARIDAVDAWARAAGRRTADDRETSPATPEVAVLTGLDARHRLPRASVRAICAGLRSDLDFAPPATVADLDRYCYRVAGAVGELVTAVLGTRGPREEALPAARSLGIAMQRTNVLRDVDEDLRLRGRVYLPADLLSRHGAGLDVRDPGRAGVVAELAAMAEREYAHGLAGVGHLAHGRPAVRAAGTTYREILRELERVGWATDRRAIVGDRRRAGLLVRALVGR